MTDASSITAITPDQYQTMLNNYATILEKTNSQLGLWSNPYGIMIGILALIIALVAIVVSILLWKNSSDQKKITKEFFAEQERLIKERNDKQDEIQKNAKIEFEKLIEEQQTKLKAADSKNKKAIEKAIDDLKREKAAVGTSYMGLGSNITTIRSGGSGGGGSLGASFTRNMICLKCGKSFNYYENLGISAVAINPIIYCPYCGGMNMPQ